MCGEHACWIPNTRDIGGTREAYALVELGENAHARRVAGTGKRFQPLHAYEQTLNAVHRAVKETVI
jgi:hypothetical protein